MVGSLSGGSGMLPLPAHFHASTLEMRPHALDFSLLHRTLDEEEEKVGANDGGAVGGSGSSVWCGD